MTDDRKGRDAPEEKNLGRSPEDKAIGRNLRPGQRSEGKPDEPEVPFGADGCFHVMEAELKAGALSKDAPENQAPIKPSVVHIMELQMKGDALGDYAANLPGIDNTLPVPEDGEGLDKPPPGTDPPLGESRSTDRNPKPTQYPASSDRRGRR